MSSLDVIRLHERCGILTACLTDPLSQLIGKIMGLREEEPNAVGFYYEADIHGVNKHTVTLFNIYDNDPIPWLRLGYTMDLLFTSPFVTKLTFYPLVTNQSESDGPLFSRTSTERKSDRNTNSKRPFMNKLEEMFRIIVIETIGINASSVHNKHLSYTTLLLKIAGITNDEADALTSKLITGYSLVNRVLLSLMNIRESNLTKIASSIIPCPLLKKPVSIIAPPENANEGEIKFVIEESRREITKLIAIFVDLYTSHDGFRSNVLATRLHGFSSHDRSLSNLESLFGLENELISHLVGGLKNGILSNGTLNNILRDLGNERCVLGNYQALPLSLNPNKTVQVTNDAILCTFQQSSAPLDTDPLRDLGIYLNHIAESFDSPDILTINLGQMITAYNNSIQNTNLSKITIPHVGGAHTVSRGAIITLPNYEGITRTKHSEPLSTPISMYNSNFAALSEAQLIDILVYIDSLRDTDGTGDTRFANLQNEITHELARRRSIT